MRSLVILLTILVGCNSTQESTKQETLADTTAAKNSYNIEATPNSTTKTVVKETDKTAANTAEEALNEDFLQRAVVSLRDSSFNVYQNIRADYRIFGYKTPDTNAKKLILFSVFTNDVEGNPHNCTYGSYYYTESLRDTKLKYKGKVGDFVEAVLIKDNQVVSPVFFEEKWVEFDD